jgi:hypothetical protein
MSPLVEKLRLYKRQETMTETKIQYFDETRLEEAAAWIKGEGEDS